MKVAHARRLDWFLLLPSNMALPVDTVTVIGGTDEMAGGLVDGGVATHWARPSAATPPAELVVAWVDAGCDVAEAASHVAPGGVFVAEIDRTRRDHRWSTFGAVSRRLRRAGCTVYSGHLVTPTFEHPRRFLPVDHAAAVRWHLDTLFIAATVPMRVARASLAAAAATPAAKPALSAAALRLMVVAVKRDAGDDARPAIIGSPMGNATERAIVLTSGYDAGSRSVVLPFGHGDASPSRVVKVATSAGSAEATAREHERLLELHDRLPDALRRALPLPIATTSLAGHTTCIQTCAAGPSLNSLTGRWGRPSAWKRRDLRTVVGWLNGLATATRADTSSTGSPWTAVYSAARALRLGDDAERLLRNAETVAEESGLAASSVYQHYDPGPWNIHLRRGSLTIIDWESDRGRPADSMGPPLADVLYAVTYWYFLASGASGQESEQDALVRLFATRVPPDADVVAGRAAIDESLASLGLGRECVPAALTALWAERAVYTAGRRQTLEGRFHYNNFADRHDDFGAESRPAAFLRTCATVIDDLFGSDGWWGFPVGIRFANGRPSRRPGTTRSSP